MKFRSFALAFTAIVGLAGAANAQSAGDFPITDANGQVNNVNQPAMLVYTFAENWTFAAVTGGFTISNDQLAAGGWPAKLAEQTDHTVITTTAGDVFTIAPVSGGFTIRDNADNLYLVDTGSAITVGGYTGKQLLFQSSPYTWTITGMSSGSAGPSIDMSDSSQIAPGANGTFLGVVSGAWTAGQTGPVGPTGATGAAGSNGTNGTNGTNAGQTGLVSAPSTCTTGQSGFDGSFIWVCTATNVTKHVAVQ